VIEMLSTVTDPEIPVNIYELGLIYDVVVSADGDVQVTMTLTTPNCPVAESMPGEVENKVGTVPGVRGVAVELVWDPPWTPDRMSEAAKLELGFI
jgi:FeS assembly SUF system protein